MWFKVDDGLPDHPKVLNAGNSALGLWLKLGAYSSKQLLDGFVPEAAVKRYGTARELQKLLVVGLLERAERPDYGHGYILHDYLDYNPSRAQALAERDRNAERQRRWKEKHLNADQPELWAGQEAGNAVSKTAPSRPVPSREEEEPLHPQDEVTRGPAEPVDISGWADRRKART